MEDYGIKELYDVVLKSTLNMEFGEKNYSPNEVILRFDKIQIAAIDEHKISRTAKGGYGNADLIFWDNTKDVSFKVAQGVLSPQSLSVLSNSKLGEIENEVISIPCSELDIQPVNNVLILKHKPNGIGFIYNKETGEKIYENINQQRYGYNVPATADYYYDYSNGGKILTIGERQFNGYLKLEGKMRLKDDNDGHEKTAIVTIPKLRITSSLAMKLGRNANPMVGNFSFVGYPVGVRSSQKVMDIIFLNDDIDSDF